MKYKKRKIAKKLLELTNHFPVAVVSGARLVGKSTLIGHRYPIEIKLNSRAKKKDARGLKSLRENHPQLKVGPG